MTKILLLTDSRGVHKPQRSTHQLYGERLAKTPGIKLTSYRCPHQWTTIPDLLTIVDRFGAENFDHVILHAGIVDHSPRSHARMLSQLIDPTDVTSETEVSEMIESRTFGLKKIVNRKRPLLDAIFGPDEVARHFSMPFEVEYEGEKTINLYSIPMMKKSLLPKLQQIGNLVFISSNNLVPNWQGDYFKPRPINMTMIEDYSRALCDALPKVINLHQWSKGQVSKFTCDNLHLTKDGSDWIFLRILEETGLRKRDFFVNRRSAWSSKAPTHWPLVTDQPAEKFDSIKMRQSEPLGPEELAAIRAKLNLKDEPLATLVIGFRFGHDDDGRRDNMLTLVDYLKHTYPGAFDILLIEQDETQKFNAEDAGFQSCRYDFLYNPNAYNRGWLYNVAAKHLTKSRVVGFLDTDVIPGANFLQCVIDCYRDFDIISPNRSLFYASADQTREFRNTGRFDSVHLASENIENPTTLAGGMLVVNRESFLAIGGFEQYVGYGCEDRALDATMLALLPKDRVRMDSFAYFHQYHPTVEAERAYFRDIYNHMAEHYGCEYTPHLTATDYIHKNCRHSDANAVAKLRDLRLPHIGTRNLYRDSDHLTVNGLPGSLSSGIKLIRVEKPAPVFPPECDGVAPYNHSEELIGKFANAWAPAVSAALAVDDTRQLQFFYNRFKGKRCFIIGNGPSLNELDLSLLKNEYTFAVNSFYYKTRETGFKPTFFVVEDSSVIKENRDQIVNYDTPFKFFPGIYQSLHPKRPGTYFFNLNRGFYDKFSPNYAIPRFSTDISKVAYCGQSVTYINLQLAYYMGFTEVYLVGMDFSYLIPASHTRKGDILTSDTDDPNHFHKDYFGKGKTWKDPKLDRVLMNYKMAKLVYDCAGRGIYNATKGGHLEEFERVDYDGMFGGIDKRFAQPQLDLTRPDETWSTRKLKVAPGGAVISGVAVIPPKPAAKPFAEESKVVTMPITPPRPAIHLFADGKPLAAEALGPEAAHAHLATAGVTGLLIYGNPRRVIAARLAKGADPLVALQDWQVETAAHLALYRQHRARLVLVEAEAAAAAPAAVLAAVQALAARADPSASQALAMPSAFLPTPDSGPADPVLLVLAGQILREALPATRLFAECQASALALPGATPDQPVSADAMAAVAAYRAQLAAAAAAGDSGRKVLAEAQSRAATEAAAAQQKLAQQAAALTAEQAASRDRAALQAAAVKSLETRLADATGKAAAAHLLQPQLAQLRLTAEAYHAEVAAHREMFAGMESDLQDLRSRLTAQAQAREAAVEALGLRDGLLDEANRRRVALEIAFAEHQTQRAADTETIAALTRERDTAQAERDEVFRSHSWLVTAPMRSLRRGIAPKS